LVLASAAWLSSGMSPVELRDALVALLRPLGARAGGRIARAASLTMAFIPWTRDELRRADEAARLRGSDPRRRPGRHLAALSVPVVSRALDKAKRGSEALALRDPGFGG
jgi:energy-coupling factor transporter transmembrane protein EcfT